MADPQNIGKYEIQGVLGHGAMGCVYRGFDPAISRAVAIKAIAKSAVGVDAVLHAHMVQRFRHEARAAGRLVHPHIVQIYDFGEDDELAYIVMELVNGKTLAQHLEQEVSYDIREVGEIIRQLLDALQHAHAAGVVHRDVKPSNILINNDGRIKISDFGIARIDSSHLTHVGDVIGTPHYMAPEQFLGQDIGPQADLFSVGVIAYELLVGRRPFTGTAAVLMQQVLNLTPVDPSQLNVRLSPLMDRVLHTALAKQPAERFQNAREFAQAFDEAIEASLNAAISGATARAGTAAPDGAALLKAARLITSAAPVHTLPADGDKPPLSAGDSAISLDTGVRKARLLVIDDEERVLTALKSLFRDRYHVFTTTDGDKALDFMRKYQVHVIISDQRMPVMPGVELLRRSRETSPRSVRILLTGYSDLAAIVGSINDGEVYRFISKPWDKTNLQTIVAEAATIALQVADTAAAPAALPHRVEAGVLVIAQDEEIFRVARELIGALCPVVHAADADAALAVMRSREIAVVLTDLDAGHAQLTGMLKRLKHENRRSLAIVVTTASDSELVIELINEAQIFRFLNKPVNVRFLKSHVHAALQRYLTSK